MTPARIGRKAARADHRAVAAHARRVPGEWVLAATYPSSHSAAGAVRKIAQGLMPAYTPADDFAVRPEAADEGVRVWVRYMGPVAPDAWVLPTGGPDDPRWHAARRAGLGGSDMAALLGMTPASRGPRHVYEEKHNRNSFITETSEMRAGRIMEPAIVAMFAEQTGLAVTSCPGTLVNRERPWMRGNVDQLVLDARGLVAAPLECKNRGAHQADKWDGAEAPDAAAAQAHWYMAVGGYRHAWVAGLLGGSKLATFRIARDEEVIGYMVEHAETWWQRHVVEGFPPPADGLKCTADLLARIWRAKPEQVEEIDLAKATDLRARYFAAKEAAKAAAREFEEIENEFRLVSGEAEAVKAGGKPVCTWKANGTFRSSAFAKEHPEVAAAYTRQVDAIDTERLAAERPDLFAAYRARVLRVPTKGA